MHAISIEANKQRQNSHFERIIHAHATCKLCQHVVKNACTRRGARENTSCNVLTTVKTAPDSLRTLSIRLPPPAPSHISPRHKEPINSLQNPLQKIQKCAVVVRMYLFFTYLVSYRNNDASANICQGQVLSSYRATFTYYRQHQYKGDPGK